MWEGPLQSDTVLQQLVGHYPPSPVESAPQIARRSSQRTGGTVTNDPPPPHSGMPEDPNRTFPLQLHL